MDGGRVSRIGAALEAGGGVLARGGGAGAGRETARGAGRETGAFTRGGGLTDRGRLTGVFTFGTDRVTGVAGRRGVGVAETCPWPVPTRVRPASQLSARPERLYWVLVLGLQYSCVLGFPNT